MTNTPFTTDKFIILDHILIGISNAIIIKSIYFIMRKTSKSSSSSRRLEWGQTHPLCTTSQTVFPLILGLHLTRKYWLKLTLLHWIDFLCFVGNLMHSPQLVYRKYSFACGRTIQSPSLVKGWVQTDCRMGAVFPTHSPLCGAAPYNKTKPHKLIDW